MEWMKVQGNSGNVYYIEYYQWLPIIEIARAAIRRHHLDIQVLSWDWHSHRGLQTQEECTKLASAMMKLCTRHKIIGRLNLSDRIYYVNNEWIYSDTKTDIIRHQRYWLFPKYKEGKLLFNPVATPYDTIVEPKPSVEFKRVLEFISFLKICGGFMVSMPITDPFETPEAAKY